MLKVITNENITDNLKNYWKSFFSEELTISEIEEILLTISEKDFDQFINDYSANKEDLLIETMVWDDINYQQPLNNILLNLKGKNCWVYFYEPVIKKYIHNLLTVIEQSNIIDDKMLFLEVVILQICTQLHKVAFQTIIAETYYAKQNKLLKGNNPIERGTYFNDILLRDNKYRKEIYTDYPELTRLLDVKVKSSIEFVISIINNTENELIEIEKILNFGEKLGKIKEINMGEGDTHNNGKSVTKIIFNTNKIIMYKPHNLDMEKRYYDFIQWINEVDIYDTYKLMAVKSYSKNDIGWTEYINYEECENKEQLKSFYFRIGRLLCILYTTNGLDIHYENIIAKKDIPIIIDLETLIHPNLFVETEISSAIDLAVIEIFDTVSKIALLPTHITSKISGKVYDVGGMGGNKQQESVFLSKFIENYGTDEVRIKKMHPIIDVSFNNPSIKGDIADSKCYKEDIINGFKKMYRWIIENKILYYNKISQYFENTIARVIYRPTNVYAQILYSSYHPDLLTNSVDRIIFLHRLATKEYKKVYRNIILEMEDMLQGDIPYFTAQANSNEVSGVHTDKINIKLDLKDSIIGSINKKINKMSEIDMYRQIAIINSKLDTEPNRENTKTIFEQKYKRKWINNEEIEFAEKIAEYLLERSIVVKNKEYSDRIWFGIEENEFGLNEFKPLNFSLYSGLAGLALFFNYLGLISKKQKYIDITKEICNSMIKFIPQKTDTKNIDSMQVGAFTGVSGIAYVLFYIDYSNKTNVYEEQIMNIFELIDNKVNNITKFDVVGDVGIIGVLISIFTKSDNGIIKDKALELSKKVFVKLNECSVKINDIPGVTWDQKGYTGYAHGNAGIISQIYRLYNIIKDENIRILANEALLFERALFQKTNNNWRKKLEEEGCSCAWCHGAPGILMGKLQLLKYGIDDKIINKEIEIAINTTIQEGLQIHWCLCHGDMGNLVILKEAGIVLNDDKLYRQAICSIESLVEELHILIETEKFKEYENNGFMTGLAGIGYEILRIQREHEMPNILILE